MVRFVGDRYPVEPGMTVKPGIMVEQGIIELVVARYDRTDNLRPDRVIPDPIGDLISTIR